MSSQYTVSRRGRPTTAKARLSLTDAERRMLRRLAMKPFTPQYVARRAQVLLALDRGMSVVQAALSYGVMRRHVHAWIGGWAARREAWLWEYHGRRIVVEVHLVAG